MRSSFSVWAVLSVAAITIVGCGWEQSKTAPSASAEPQAADGAKYLLSAEPAGAHSVIDARKEAKHDDEVVVVGRIGGSQNPWIENRAVFSIVDSSLKACSDIPGDGCKTPWDYCCQTDQLPTSTTLVKFVDETGNPLNVDARELLKVKELQTVVVRGKAKRDDAGNLTVLADGIYVRK
jgi:hypothetical protein